MERSRWRPAATTEKAAGGTLEFLQLGGTITVSAPSRIAAIYEASPVFSGTFLGSGELTFENPGQLRYPFLSSTTTPYACDRNTSITGHSPDYSGNVHIGTGTVSIRNADSLGTGDLFVEPAGTLALSPGSGKSLDLLNDIHLAGGELTGFIDTNSTQRLLGGLYVSGRSFLGQVEVTGSMYLSDGSTLTTLLTSPHGSWETSSWVAKPPCRLAAQSFARLTSETIAGALSLAGVLCRMHLCSRLQFIEAGLDELVLDASIHVRDGESLEILRGDALAPLVLSS